MLAIFVIERIPLLSIKCCNLVLHLRRHCQLFEIYCFIISFSKTFHKDGTDTNTGRLVLLLCFFFLLFVFKLISFVRSYTWRIVKVPPTDFPNEQPVLSVHKTELKQWPTGFLYQDSLCADTCSSGSMSCFVSACLYRCTEETLYNG